MVARGAGAPGPVLLACRQWDPLGLARRLPSLGVGAWRCAPLLPWRVQCPVCVCAALAAGSGGFGPVPGVVSPLLPPSRPACSALRVAGRPVRVYLILARWYAIPCGLCVPRARSGCPSGGPRVSFSCVCARAVAVSAPRWVVWRAHLAWSRHWALVGPFHVVRAPPRVLPQSRAPSGVLGGGRSGPGSPLLGLGLWGRRQGVPGGVPSTVALWARGCGCGGPALFLWGGGMHRMHREISGIDDLINVADGIDLIFKYRRLWTHERMKREAPVAVSIMGVIRDLQKVCQANDWLFEDRAPFLRYKVDLLLRRHQLRGLRGTSRLGYKRYGCAPHRTQDLAVQLQEYFRLGEQTEPYAYNAVAPGAPIDLVQLATIYQTGPGRLGYHDFDKAIRRVAALHSSNEEYANLFPFVDAPELVRRLGTSKYLISPFEAGYEGGQRWRRAVQL